MGYDLNKPFMNVKDKESATDIDWEELADYHIVITNELSTIHTYKKIEYFTENVIVSEDRKMATITSEGQAVIVFK